MESRTVLQTARENRTNILEGDNVLLRKLKNCSKIRQQSIGHLCGNWNLSIDKISSKKKSSKKVSKNVKNLFTRYTILSVNHTL